MTVKNPTAAKLLAVVIWLIEKAYGVDLRLKPKLEIDFMITVADNTPDGTVKASLGEVRDEEGALIPASLADPTSDQTSAFAWTSITNDGKNLSAGFHVGGPNDDGSPATATVKFDVKRDDTGEVIDTFSETIKVVSGKPTSIPLTVDLSAIGTPDIPAPPSEPPAGSDTPTSPA